MPCSPCLVSAMPLLWEAGPGVVTTDQASAKPNTEWTGKAEVLKEI